jgi:hypothetical protein
LCSSKCSLLLYIVCLGSYIVLVLAFVLILPISALNFPNHASRRSPPLDLTRLFPFRSLLSSKQPSSRQAYRTRLVASVVFLFPLSNLLQTLVSRSMPRKGVTRFSLLATVPPTFTLFLAFHYPPRFPFLPIPPLSASLCIQACPPSRSVLLLSLAFPPFSPSTSLLLSLQDPPNVMFTSR